MNEETTRPIPQKCPGCGKPVAKDWIRGWHGWECGSYAMNYKEEDLNFQESIECAVEHWKQRALNAEHLLKLLSNISRTL